MELLSDIVGGVSGGVVGGGVVLVARSLWHRLRAGDAEPAGEVAGDGRPLPPRPGSPARRAEREEYVKQIRSNVRRRLEARVIERLAEREAERQAAEEA